MMEDLRKDIDLFLEALLLFVARGVLANEWTFSRRRQRLEAMGFTILQPPPGIAFSMLIVVMILLAGSLTWFVLIGFPTEQSKAFRLFKGLTTGSLVILCNFPLVYYLKKRYAFANVGIFGGMPILFILSIGFVAALLLIPVRGMFDYFLYRDEHGGSISL